MELILSHTLAALSHIASPTLSACELALGCSLSPTADPRQQIGTCPNLSVARVDLRLGRAGGVIVLEFASSIQSNLADARHDLPPPISVDVVSPHLVATVRWSKKWSECYRAGEADVWLHLEEQDGHTLLTSASRHLGPRVETSLS